MIPKRRLGVQFHDGNSVRGIFNESTAHHNSTELHAMRGCTRPLKHESIPQLCLVKEKLMPMSSSGKKLCQLLQHAESKKLVKSISELFRVCSMTRNRLCDPSELSWV